jgi:hypothetical protein
MKGGPESTTEEDKYNLEIMLKNTIHALLRNYHKNLLSVKNNKQMYKTDAK